MIFALVFIIGFVAGGLFVAWGVWKKAETHDMTRIGALLHWRER